MTERGDLRPFAVPFEAIQADMEPFIDAVVASLASEFMTMPKGEGFVEYSVFERGYEALRRTSNDFRMVHADAWCEAVAATPIAICVMRAMLGLTPPEWAFIATQRTGVTVTQSYIRNIDRSIRLAPNAPLPQTAHCRGAIRALVETACLLLTEGPPDVAAGELHRLNKVDTVEGVHSLHAASRLGVPYAMLLYERFLGRPFASHRDSVSEIVGDALETRIERILDGAGVPHQKTKRADRVPGFDQAPDFVVPEVHNPRVIIEAKVSEDDGTARDKVTRIQHLATIAADWPEPIEVVACISGRGFGVRRSDVRKLLEATRGKLFTLGTLEQLVEYTALSDYASRSQGD